MSSRTGMEWHHLPRLEDRYYQGCAAVLWTLTLQPRTVGWLDALFHARFREWLVHAGAREGLLCPAYVLMPDHAHLVWLGACPGSDQRLGMRFLRKYVQREFDLRSAGSVEYRLQKQSHDRVLSEQDREQGALSQACRYVLNNPCRAGLVTEPGDWPYMGSVVPGYPFLDPREDGFWDLFWRFYGEARNGGCQGGGHQSAATSIG